MDKVVFSRQVSEFSGQSAAPIQGNNLLRLKRISQSFDDLTSETLYSKWKKARKSSAKAARRDRSISLTLLPEDELVGLDTSGDKSNEGTDSLAASLQRQLFRPIGWSVGNGEHLRDNTEGAVNISNNCKDELSDSASLSLSEIDNPSCLFSISSENLDDDVFSLASPKKDLNDTIETKKSKIIKEIMSRKPTNIFRKSRSLSESERPIPEGLSARCRKISDPNSETRSRSLSCREPREIEFLRTAEMAQRYLDSTKAPAEGIWQKRSSTGDLVAEGRHKRMPNTTLIHARSEVNNNACNIQEASLRFTTDRSQPEAKKRYLVGHTYALIRQPEPQFTNSHHEVFLEEESYLKRNNTSEFYTRTMSEPAKGSDQKESRSTEEKEKDDRSVKFKEVEFVTDFKVNQRTESGHHGPTVRRAQTLPRMPKRPLTSLTSRGWKESELKTRKAAEDLINNINNSDDKSAQERVDIVEKAFEWIRKEVADLRAQDKDIMRMFTKIQAGIRHIKFDQSSLMESEDECISTPDLSSTQSCEEKDRGIHRRASLL